MPIQVKMIDKVINDQDNLNMKYRDIMLLGYDELVIRLTLVKF